MGVQWSDGMAWNEPDGNGDRDPWGNRGRQQAPPDLDEVLRKLQTRWGRVFGRRSGGGGRPGRGFGGGLFGRGGFLGFGARGGRAGGSVVARRRMDRSGAGTRRRAALRRVPPHDGSGLQLGAVLRRFGGDGQRRSGPQRGDRVPQSGNQRRRRAPRSAHADRGREHRRSPVRGAVSGQGLRAVPVREQ